MNEYSSYVVRCWGAFMLDFFRAFNPTIPIKVNKTESKTMFSIYLYEGNSMSFYCNILGLENGSFTSIADNLEKKGLVRRDYSHDDKRMKVLNLTDYGRELAALVKEQLGVFLDDKLQALTEEERNSFIAAISAIEKLRGKL